jgi:mono/diheme cytochrome c family protein
MRHRLPIVVSGLVIGVLPLISAVLVAQVSTPKGEAASAAPSKPPAAGSVSFRKDIGPIFRDNCTMCHQPESPMAGLALTQDEAYDNLVGGQSAEVQMLRVAPGKPESSYLYYKVAGRNVEAGGVGMGMPWGGRLSKAEIEQIRRWIEQGALNN